MATMTAQEVIDLTRFFLNDQDSASERWDDDELVMLINIGVDQVTSLRPDALYSATGTLLTITPAVDETSTLSIDSKWKVALANFVAMEALNKQAGQTFNDKKVASLMTQFTTLIKV